MTKTLKCWSLHTLGNERQSRHHKAQVLHFLQKPLCFDFAHIFVQRIQWCCFNCKLNLQDVLPSQFQNILT